MTAAELTSGLSNVASIPAGTGILFDMGSDKSGISINMSQMLFNLDIAFINSEHGVVGVLHNVEAGEDALFDAGSGLGARYFLEVNAGELDDVSVGDTVDISGEVQASFWSAVLVALPSIAIISTAGASMYQTFKQEKK